MEANPRSDFASASRLKAGLRWHGHMGRRIAHRRYPMPYVRILGFVTLLLKLVAAAAPVSAAAPIPADQAFQLRAQLDAEEGVELIWSIVPGYYLYRERIA